MRAEIPQTSSVLAVSNRQQRTTVLSEVGSNRMNRDETDRIALVCCSAGTLESNRRFVVMLSRALCVCRSYHSQQHG